MLSQLHDEQQQQRRAAAAARHSKPRATLSSLQQGRNPPRSPQLPSTAVKPATTAARTAPVAASAATLASTAPGPGSPARGGSPAGAALRAYLPRAPHTPLRATAERLGPDLALSGAAHTTASRLHGGVPGPGGGSGGRGGREGSARHAGPGAGAGASPAAPRLYPLLKRSASAGPASSRTSSLPAAGGCTAAAPAKAAAAGALVSSPAANTSTGRPPARPSTVQGGAWAAAREEQQQRAGSCYLPPPSPGGSRTRGHGGRPASAPDEAIGGGPGGPGASSAGGASAAAAAAGAAGIGLGAQPQGQGRFRQLLRLQALLLQVRGAWRGLVQRPLSAEPLQSLRTLTRLWTTCVAAGSDGGGEAGVGSHTTPHAGMYSHRLYVVCARASRRCAAAARSSGGGVSRSTTRFYKCRRLPRCCRACTSTPPWAAAMGRTRRWPAAWPRGRPSLGSAGARRPPWSLPLPLPLPPLR